jgi:hypothetical protein
MRAPAVLAAAAILCAAGCGGGGVERDAAAPASGHAQPWQANARGVLAQLRFDVSAAEAGGATTRRAAARALADTSELYGLLVAYSDLGGCRRMAAGAAAPPRVARALALPCGHLQRAAALFSRAAKESDPEALVAAAQQVRLAQPQLVRAALALRRG